MTDTSDTSTSDTPRLLERVAIFKAMAHPARLTMLEALGKGERCVCELTELVGLDITTVSKHLAILRQAGLVSSTKRGTWAYYRLVAPCVLTFLSCLETNPVRQGDSAGCACRTDGGDE